MKRLLTALLLGSVLALGCSRDSAHSNNPGNRPQTEPDGGGQRTPVGTPGTKGGPGAGGLTNPTR